MFGITQSATRAPFGQRNGLRSTIAEYSKRPWCWGTPEAVAGFAAAPWARAGVRLILDFAGERGTGRLLVWLICVCKRALGGALECGLYCHAAVAAGKSQAEWLPAMFRRDICEEVQCRPARAMRIFSRNAVLG